MQAPLVIYTFGAFAELERDAQLGIGIYDGILLALFFYNLILWLSLRDSSHFWYMCHLAGFGLVLFCLNGLAFEYLWPNYPWLANHAIPLAMCLSQMAMHQFARTFLELRSAGPAADMLSLAFIIFLGALAIASFWVAYRTSVRIGTYAVFPTVLLLLYQAFHADPPRLPAGAAVPGRPGRCCCWARRSTPRCPSACCRRTCSPSTASSSARRWR
jgi:hypothetical protein